VQIYFEFLADDLELGDNFFYGFFLPTLRLIIWIDIICAKDECIDTKQLTEFPHVNEILVAVLWQPIIPALLQVHSI